MNNLVLLICRLQNKMIAFALACLGFVTACSESPSEYGTPNAKFMIKGTVSSAVSKKAIKGIRVISRYDTAFSALDGSYKIELNTFPDSQDFLVKVEDIDSELNGLYLPTDTLLSVKNPTFKGGDGNWYSGETESELNIELTPKVK